MTCFSALVFSFWVLKKYFRLFFQHFLISFGEGIHTTFFSFAALHNFIEGPPFTLQRLCEVIKNMNMKLHIVAAVSIMTLLINSLVVVTCFSRTVEVRPHPFQLRYSVKSFPQPTNTLTTSLLLSRILMCVCVNMMRCMFVQE